MTEAENQSYISILSRVWSYWNILILKLEELQNLEA